MCSKTNVCGSASRIEYPGQLADVCGSASRIEYPSQLADVCGSASRIGCPNQLDDLGALFGYEAKSVGAFSCPQRLSMFFGRRYIGDALLFLRRSLQYNSR